MNAHDQRINDKLAQMIQIYSLTAVESIFLHLSAE